MTALGIRSGISNCTWHSQSTWNDFELRRTFWPANHESLAGHFEILPDIYVRRKRKPSPDIFEPTCAYARWAHMHRFLSVCLSVCNLTKIQTRKKLISQKVFKLQAWNFDTLWGIIGRIEEKYWLHSKKLFFTSMCKFTKNHTRKKLTSLKVF